MRSRYTAFVVNNAKYIIKTTHKENQEFTTNTTQWLQDIELFSKNSEFQKLDILEFIDGEKEAYVTFRATIISNGSDCSFCEKSRFLKEDGIWLYHSGEFL